MFLESNWQRNRSVRNATRKDVLTFSIMSQKKIELRPVKRLQVMLYANKKRCQNFSIVKKLVSILKTIKSVWFS